MTRIIMFFAKVLPFIGIKKSTVFVILINMVYDHDKRAIVVLL